MFQINPVKGSRRDGINYVFNGQHTIEIVAQVSGSRETPVWCMVYDDLAYEREADIFVNQMKSSKPLNPYEIFMANIEAGSDDEIIMKASCRIIWPTDQRGRWPREYLRDRPTCRDIRQGP